MYERFYSDLVDDFKRFYKGSPVDYNGVKMSPALKTSCEMFIASIENLGKINADMTRR